jgi:hypothetical protein
MRPIGRFFVENIFQKINENAPDDANLRTQFESLFEGDKPQTFAEYLEPEATVVADRADNTGRKHAVFRGSCESSKRNRSGNV